MHNSRNARTPIVEILVIGNAVLAMVLNGVLVPVIHQQFPTEHVAAGSLWWVYVVFTIVLAIAHWYDNRSYTRALRIINDTHFDR